MEEERANVELQIEEICRRRIEAENKLAEEQRKLTKQIKKKEQTDKEVQSQETELEKLQRNIMTERSMLKREQEAADERMAI